MDPDNDLTNQIKHYCENIDIDLVGFADPKHFERYQQINQPEKFLEDTKTVIVIGFHLFDINLDAYCHDPIKGVDYHFADSIIELRCHRIKDFLADKGYKSKIISYTPGLFLKEVAALAGIGPIGKNNLLLTKEYGSQVRLRALVTNAPLVCGRPIVENEFCKECDLCIQACPAGAFPDGKYKRGKCQRYQLKNLKWLSDKTTIWCNECIEACPWYKKN